MKLLRSNCIVYVRLGYNMYVVYVMDDNYVLKKDVIRKIIFK